MATITRRIGLAERRCARCTDAEYGQYRRQCHGTALISQSYAQDTHSCQEDWTNQTTFVMIARDGKQRRAYAFITDRCNACGQRCSD